MDNVNTNVIPAGNDLLVQQTTTYNYTHKLTTMTPEERTHYLALSDNIKVGNMSTIMAYGSELSTIIAENGNSLLESVSGSNNNEVIQLTNQLLAKLKLIDINDLNQKSFKNTLRRMPIVKYFMKKIDEIKIQYNTVKENIMEISKEISQKKVLALRDNGTLESIYNNNVNYLSQLRDLILAAKVKEDEISQQITEMQTNPEVDPYQVHDAVNFKNALSKRIADMVVTEHILYQNLYQIRAIQGNNIAIANKADNIVKHIIPMWRDQITIAITVDNQKASIDATNRITQATQEILTKNAYNLKMNSIEVAKATEESIVSLDTLRETKKTLIETVDEVNKIHSEGAKARLAAEQTIVEFREELERKLLIE